MAVSFRPDGSSGGKKTSKVGGPASDLTSIISDISKRTQAAGKKIYGQVSSSPTMGPVDKTGYAERDRKKSAHRNAVLRKIQGMNRGAYADTDVKKMGI
jgi:hypothetical protein